MRFRGIPLGLAVLSLLVAAIPVRATTVIQPTFDTLVGSSDYIVRAVVKSVDSEWRENADRPGERYIGSKVTLEVREVIKGNPPSPLVLDMVGGRVGEDELTIDGAPKFVVGEESVLFVRDNGKNFFPLVGLMHGFFPVRHDARAGDQMLRHNRRLLYSEKELDPSAVIVGNRSAQDRALTPAAFRDRIQERQRTLLNRAPLK